MNHRLIITEGAAQDIIEAYVWYEEQREGLGEELLTTLDAGYTYVLNYPTACKKVYKSFRQLVLRQFPYVMIYELEGRDVIVYSVFHTSRSPSKKFPER